MATPEPKRTALAPSDFSKEGMSKAVLKEVASDLRTTIPMALGVVGIASIAALSAPVWVAAPLLFGGGWFAINYWLRYDTNAEYYLETIRNIQRQLVAEMPKRLQSDLKAAGSEKGLHQLKELEDSFADFHELLEKKFSTRGMTLNRFLGTAEQVRAGALYKLQMVLDQMKAVESISPDLEKQSKSRSASGEQARLIQERAGHRKQALEEIESLHTDVEESLTRLSEISVRIAKVGMGDNEEAKFESYLAELRALASQASSFRKET